MASRTDSTQAGIVAALRAAGCSVQPLHMVGKGCPDLLVGRAWKNYVLEVKILQGKRKPRHSALRESQVAWMRAWAGQKEVVATIEEALAAVGLRVAV